MHGKALLAKRTSKSSVRAESLAVGPGPGSHVVLGIDIGGRAELCGQIDDIAAGDLEVATLVYPAAFRIDQGARNRVGDRACLSMLRHRTAL